MKETNGMIVQIAEWSAIPWLRHGFSTRRGGVTTVYLTEGESDADLNLGWTKDDDPVNVAENRRRLRAAVMGCKVIPDTPSSPPPVITLRQVHSAVSLVVPQNDADAISAFTTPEGRAAFEADGMMTSGPGILLGIQTADCVPVFVVDVEKRVVASFHAGWRGTAARIVERGVAQMISEYGSRPGDLLAAVGPSIGACCYAVGEQVHAVFTADFAYGGELFRAGPSHSEWYLDLWEANRRQFLDSGIVSARIAVIGECTGCTGLPGRRKYFSHRRENGFTGRMMNVIGIVG